MNANIKQWLTVYLVPYILIGIFTSGAGLLIFPIAGIFGVFIPLFTTAPYLTVSFKALFFLVLILSIVLFFIGYKLRTRLWGKIVNASGFYLWCMAGLVGLGPV